MIVSFCFSFTFLRRIYLYCVGAQANEHSYVLCLSIFCEAAAANAIHLCGVYKNANGIDFNRIDSRGFSTCLMCNPKRAWWRRAAETARETLNYILLMIKYQVPNVCLRLPAPIDINELVFSFWIFSSFISFGSVGRWRVCFCLSFRRHCAVPCAFMYSIMRILCLTFINFRRSDSDPSSSWEMPEKQKKNEFRKQTKKNVIEFFRCSYALRSH